MGIGETMDLSLNEALSVNVYDGIWFKKNLKRIYDFYIETQIFPEMGLADINIDEIAEFYEFFFKNCVKIVSINDSRRLMESHESVIFEGAQGILLDETYGFNPYTTWSSTTTKNADQFLSDIDYQGEVTRIGVSRTYHTRHGDGPFPSERPHQFDEPHNSDKGFQGVFREGWFDAVMMRYAIDVQEKFNELDGIAWTHTDRKHKSGTIRNYIYNGMRIDKLIPGQVNTDILSNCKPSDEIGSFWFSGEFGKMLITSNGPRTNQKTFYEI
jgi:adenylosuccinate synthase